MKKKLSYKQLLHRVEELEKTLEDVGCKKNLSTYPNNNAHDYSAWLSHATLFVYELDLDGYIICEPTEKLSVFGVNNCKVNSAIHYLDGVAPSSHYQVRQLLEHASTGNVVPFFEFFAKTDRGCINFESSFIPVYSRKNTVIKLICIARDISGLQLIEKENKLAKESAEKANYAKSQFMANVSYELRAPMNEVLGAAQLLQQKDIPKEQQELVKIIYSSSRILTSIVNDLLDLSAIDADKIHIRKKPINIQQIVQDIFSMFEAHAKSKGLRYQFLNSISSAEYMLGDSVRISQVLFNLLANAIKFTSEGRVVVNVGCNVIAKNLFQVVVSVTDSGIGIPCSIRQEIFNSFTDIDLTVSKGFGGIGLGLWISKKLCKLMNGTLEFNAIAGGGASFTMKIPMKRADNIQYSIPLHESPVVSRKYSKQVLLVDDNITNQMVEVGMLNKLGLDVDVANNGKEAIERCNDQCYDLILMDVHMPVIDGLTATQQLRARESMQAVPIIALTASASDEDNLKCKEAGMNGFLSKPFTWGELIKEIDPWM